MSAPDNENRVVSAERGRYRVFLARGTLRVSIVAPPGRLIVDTATSTAVDLGCAFEITADDAGNGTLHVLGGWAAYTGPGHSAFVPAGAVCVTRRGLGPGTPHFENRSPEFLRAIDVIDTGRDDVNVRQAIDLHVIGLLEVRLGCGDARGPRTVVRQEQQAFACLVETADGRNPRQCGAFEQCIDRVAAALVGRRRDVAARLVQHEIDALGCADFATIERDAVALGVDRPLRIANDPAVDRDAALARVERGLRARARAELRQRARKTVARRSWRLALQG